MEKKSRLISFLNQISFKVYLVIALAVIGVVVFFKPKSEEPLDYNIIRGSIRDIGEIATLEYEYTEIAESDKPASFFNIDIPFTNSSFFYTYDGTAKFGINAEKISIEVEADKINVTIPKGELLSHETGNNLQQFDVNNNIFNPINPDDLPKEINEKKKKMEEKFKEKDFYKRAQQSSKTLIENILRPIVKDDTNITFTFE